MLNFLIHVYPCALGGRDYGSFPEEELRLPVVILADESSFEFGILIREDERVEATESFTVRLIVPDGTPGVQEAEQNTEAVVLIEDNDCEFQTGASH